MSATGPAPATPGAFLCPRCGSALRDEQGWCLECGLAARTRIHPPPSWRVPVALTCVLLALLAAGIALALVTLLDTSQPKPAPATVTVPATAPTTPSATTPTTTAPSFTTTTPQTTVPSVTTPTTPKTPTTPPTSTNGAAQPPASTSGGAQGAVK